jgi:O-antigen/teichoic acid export membrane protein
MMFAVGIVLARSLGKEEFGLYALLLTIGTVGSSLAAFGIPQAATKFLAERSDLSRMIPGHSLLLITCSSLVVGAFLIFGASWIASDFYGTSLLIPYLRLIAGYVVTLTIYNLFLALLQGLNDIGSYNRVSLFGTACHVVAVSVGAAWLGTIGAIWATVLASVVSLIFALVTALPRLESVNLRLRIDGQVGEAVRPIARYTAFMMAGGMVASLAQWYAPTLLVKFHDYGSLGMFRVANLISANLLIIPMAMGIPLIPSLASLYSRKPEGFTALSKDSFRLVVGTTLPLALVLCLLSEEVLQLCFGMEFASDWQILFVMSVAGFLMALNHNAGSLFYGTGEFGPSLVINIVWGVVFLATGWFLILDLGPLGLGFTYVASYLVITVLQLFYQRMKWGIVIEDLGAVSMTVIVAFALAYLLKISLHGYPFYIFGGGLVVIVIALGYSWLTTTGAVNTRGVADALRNLRATFL